MDDLPTPYRLSLWRRLPLVLAMVVVALLIGHIWALVWVRTGGRDPWDLHPYVTLFSADDEPGFPAWFAMASLLFSAALTFALARAKKDRCDRDTRYWNALAILLCFLSFDEIVTFHEAVEEIPIAPWQLAGGALAVLIVLGFVPFLRRLPSPTRGRFLTAAALYIGGAVVVDYVTGPGGIDVEFEVIAYAFTTALEAGMRMFGVVIFVGALLNYMRTYSPEDRGPR